MDRVAIGIDIGGTNLRLALVSDDGKILGRYRTASSIHEGRERFCARLLDGIASLRCQAAEACLNVAAVGVGIPGLIGRDGLIRASVNLRPLEGFNLGFFLEQQVGLPVFCGNDANVIAVGEQHFGSGAGLSSFLTVTIGTGLGSGLVLDNRLWSGAGGFAAEFGHVTVQPDGLPCICGNRGCLEQYVSAGALLRCLVNQRSGLTSAEEVAHLARQGDSAACAAFSELGRWLGIAVASLLNTLNLQAVIIGGGVAASFDLLRPALAAEIDRRCFPQIAAGCAIVKSELGDDAGLLGGAALTATGATE
jgi:glucokinase